MAYQPLHRHYGSDVDSRELPQQPAVKNLGPYKANIQVTESPRGSMRIKEPSFAITGSQPPQWQPFWLKKLALAGLAFLFALTIAALLALRSAVTQEHGLTLTVTTSHYAWKYGPTAILICLVTLWRQVDYFSKLLQPWKNMQQGHVAAARSVLLDYVSQFPVISFVDAIRFRDAPVAVSLLGVVVLKLVIVFSTGLLVSVPTKISKDGVPATIQNRFDVGSWNTTQESNGLDLALATSNPITDANTTQAVYTYYGITFENLEPPLGYQNGISFQFFDPVGQAPNTLKMTAMVDAFIPETKCEATNITTAPDESRGGSAVTVTIRSPTYHTEFSTGSFNQMEAFVESVTCSEGGDRIALELWDIPQKQMGSDARVAVALCSLSYKMSSAPLTFSYNDGVESSTPTLGHPSAGSVNRQLSGLNATQFSNAVLHSLTDSDNIFTGNSSNDQDSSGPPALFHLMALSAGSPTADLSSLFGDATMSQAAEKVFNGISALFALENWMVAEQSSVNGTLVYHENRLQIRSLSLWAMITCLATLTVLSLLFIYIRAKYVAPKPPDTIEASAAIASASPNAQQALNGMSYCTDEEIKKHLEGHEFTTKGDGAFRIEMRKSTIKASSTSQRPSVGAERKAWVPLASRYPIICLTIRLPLVAVAILEVLQRLSDHNSGLVDGGNDTAEYFSGISTLLLTIVAMLFNGLEYTICQFNPFAILRKSTATANRTIRSNIVRRTPLVSLWHALRFRHIGVAFANIAGFLGFFLTIVSSGLWYLDTSVISQQSLSVQRLDTWNTTSWVNKWLNDSGAALTLNLIQNEDLNYPKWTAEELAFPKIGSISQRVTQPGNASNSSSDEQVFHFTLPALRANLDYAQISPSEFKMLVNNNTEAPNEFGFGIAYTPLSIEVDFPVHLPPKCLVGKDKNQSSISVSMQYQPADQNDNVISGTFEGFQGEMFDLLIRSAAAHESCAGCTGGFDTVIDPFGCPSLVFAFGFMNFASLYKKNITAFACSQQLQEISTSVSFNHTSAGQKFSEANIVGSPIPDESTVKLLTNGTDGVTAFPFHI
ncbi:MAG: hypothetical protein Q9227_006087 [Pyrenula ochraceoflavens]